jgi:hypothetical protein
MDIPDSTEIIKTTFQSVVDKNVEITQYFTNLNDKKNRLTSLYKQLLDENSNIVSTLDIFNFQIRLLGNDIVYLQQKYNNINNRIYCQYFKIYLQVQEYILESIPEIQIPKASFPTYDDTNLNKVYDFKTICEIHDFICNMICGIIEYVKIRNQEYKKYQTINNVGVHINVFVDTFKHNIKAKIDQMLLFTNMVRFFNTSGLNYYNKIFNTIEFINTNISNDISFDTLEHITINPEYIEDGPLPPLETEECPSPIIPILPPSDDSSNSSIVIETRKSPIVSGNVSTSVNTFNNKVSQPVQPVQPLIATAKPLVTVKPSAPPITPAVTAVKTQSPTLATAAPIVIAKPAIQITATASTATPTATATATSTAPTATPTAATASAASTPSAPATTPQ